MRIISKFRDYYDVTQAHGADDDLLMLRETVEHKAPDNLYHVARGKGGPPTPFQPLLLQLEGCFTARSYDHDRTYQGTRKWNALKVLTGVVVFVGKPYLYFKTERTLKDAPLGTPAEVRFIYDLHELDALAQEHGAKSLFERSSPSRWTRYREKSWALQAWELVQAKSFKDLAFKLEAPIIHVTSRYKCYTYPRLADVHFYKVVDPWDAYQELSMFLGNIAAPDRVPVTIADKDRVQQHGFDMKYGFRTRPKD